MPTKLLLAPGFSDLSTALKCTEKYYLNILYFTDIPSDVAKRGITLELCAGIVDKEGKSLAEIATEEGRTSIRFYDFDYLCT